MFGYGADKSTKKNPVNVKFTGFFLYKIRTLPRVLKIFYL